MSRTMTFSILSTVEKYEESINYLLNQLSPNKIYDSIVLNEDWELKKKKDRLLWKKNGKPWRKATDLSIDIIEKEGFFYEVLDSKSQLEIGIPFSIDDYDTILGVEINGDQYEGGFRAKENGKIVITVNYNRIAAQEFDNIDFETDYFGELYKLANRHFERIFLTICGYGKTDNCPWECAVFYNESGFANFYNCRMIYHNLPNKFSNDILISNYCKENNLYVPELWSKNKELFQNNTNSETIWEDLQAIATNFESIKLIADDHGRHFLISLIDDDLSEFYKKIKNTNSINP